MRQNDLAAALNQSPSYVNQIITGRKPANAEWCDLVANTLRLTKEQRRGLHAQAAKQHGFKL